METYVERRKLLFQALKNQDYQTAKVILPKTDSDFVRFVDSFIAENGLVRQNILLKADIAQSYGYKILTGQKHTNNRNLILRLLIAMKMDLDHIQKGLALYGMNILCDSGRDEIIITGIIFQQTIDEIDEWLISLDMERLMDSYDT